MNDRRFDDIIKSKLSNLSSDATPDWEEFLKRKNSSIPITDQEFDEKIHSALIDYENPNPPLQWDLLSARFKQIIYLRKQVLTIKSGELLIFLLCCFTFTNYYNNLTPYSKGSPESVPIADHVLDHRIFQNQAMVHNENLSSKEGFIYKNSSVDFTSTTMSSEQNAISRGNEFTVSNELKRQNKNSKAGLIVEVPGEPLNEPYFTAVESNSKTIINDLEGSKIFSIGKIKSREISLQFHSLIPEIPLTSIIDLEENSQSQDSKWFQFYTSINNNSIKSPKDEIYNLDEHLIYAPGFSVAALYSIEKSKLEFASGLTYSRISYMPYPIKESYQTKMGINVTSLNNISYDVISVPVITKIHVVKNQDWSMFASIGMQAGLVVNEKYDITDELDIPLPRPEQAGGTVEYRSRLSQKDFSPALFNGGKLSDNLIVHGNVGLGVQRHLSDKLCLYLSGEYSYHLVSRLGPNNDKINVFGFGAGLKFRL